MNLAKEIHNFKESRKTHIPLEMYVLWEYKLSKTQSSRSCMFDILRSDNVYLKLADNSNVSLKDLSQDEFYFMMSLYKKYNKKLYSFISKRVNI